MYVDSESVEDEKYSEQSLRKSPYGHTMGDGEETEVTQEVVMKSKKSAAIILGLLALTMVVVGVSTPDLAYFIGGGYDSMFEIGKTVGGALADALGMEILELVGIILFIA